MLVVVVMGCGCPAIPLVGRRSRYHSDATFCSLLKLLQKPTPFGAKFSELVLSSVKGLLADAKLAANRFG